MDITHEPVPFLPPPIEGSANFGKNMCTEECLAPEPASSPHPSISGLENLEKNTGSFTESSWPPCLEGINPEPMLSPPSPSHSTNIPGSMNPEKNIESSRDNHLPSGMEGFVPKPVLSHPPISASVNLKNSNNSSPEPSVPPGWDIPLTGSLNLEKNMGHSPDTSRPPGWENFNLETNPASINVEKSMFSSPETSASPGWENSSLHPSPFEDSVDVMNVYISPENSRPPGWEGFVPESIPPPPIPVSQSIEKKMGSSAKMSRPPGWENYGSQPIPALLPGGMGQMVCGSCRQLLSYPQGTMRVKCPCCQTINFVLEEHQVGTVKCAKCWVWLMYPYGAPSVRCSACHFVTNIGPNNARPPLSVQQRRSSVSQSPVH